MSATEKLIARLRPDRHVLIAGPTASGKSALALAISQAQGGTIVNADALQVWSCWRVLTARPSAQDEAQAPHALYGHVSPDRAYSVGDWLAEVAALPGRLIITGGTGLYLSSLTRGLAVIPPVAPQIRAEADQLAAEADGLARMIAGLDARTALGIDLLNPARVQRAWEVLRATGRGLAEWQAETPPPLIAPDSAECLVLNADRDWLADRIATRFRAMMASSALEEARARLADWDPRRQWARAIGAAELIAHLKGQMSREDAIERSIIATRQYAKSQRIWFRGRMREWSPVVLP